MSIWEALILGIVQGATEFLPVSSSGHLVLLQRIFKISEPTLVFDIAVHGGTLLAVLVILRKDIWNILRRLNQALTLYLIIATIPAVLAALLFRRQIEHAFSSGAYLGFAFIITSALLLISDLLSRRNKNPGVSSRMKSRSQTEMTWKDALLIGLLQALAVIPGISRSGATISGALMRKLNRDLAARFSFLLSIPAILGALTLHVREFSQLWTAADSGLAIGLLPLIVGVCSASIVAFFSIRLALKIVREHSLIGFSVYTAILGLLVLADKFGTRIFF